MLNRHSSRQKFLAGLVGTSSTQRLRQQFFSPHIRLRSQTGPTLRLAAIAEEKVDPKGQKDCLTPLL